MPSFLRDRAAIFRAGIEVERSTLRGNIILLLLFALQAGAVYVTMWREGLLSHFKPSLYQDILPLSLAGVLFVKVIAYLLRYVNYDKAEKNLARVREDFLRGWLNANYMLAFLVPLLLLPTFISLFSSLKSVIHLIQPFYLDEFFMKADRFIHFGVDPWRITHSIFGTARLSVMLNFCYNLWFFIMFFYVLWQIVNVHLGRLRMQFLFAFVISWPLIGSFLAVFLSSAGPVYYGDIVGDPSVYGPMMDALAAFNKQYEDSFFGIYALATQDMLWADYLKNDTGIGSGISAMPSMHVAVAALLYFSAREVNKYMGYGLLVFLVLIQVGSVHLGWHYAIDGYVSILLTWGIWKFSGWLVGRFSEPDPDNQVQCQPPGQIG
ncbi:MAG: hypothetical protein COB49_08735 [Alphaproteobacteria bacterium]|nr:MAG: hypothetical protein COB49_08735 [Alphaproteobacteria bacterium]